MLRLQLLSLSVVAIAEGVNALHTGLQYWQASIAMCGNALERGSVMHACRLRR